MWEWLGAASASHRGGPGSSSCLPGAVFLPLPLYHSSLLHLPSPSVGFLQPPGSEQYQMPQSPSPCSPPQMPQQYSGKRIKNWGVLSTGKSKHHCRTCALEPERAERVQGLALAPTVTPTRKEQSPGWCCPGVLKLTSQER